MYGVYCLGLHVGQDVRVNIKRDFDVAVAKHLTDDFYMHSLL
jgi:hypothetical protein